MRDKLEDFISENKEAFDLYEPGPDLWNKIEKDVSKKKRISMRTVLWRAAAVILIFGASFVFNRYISLISQENDIAVEIPEVKEAEIYYSSMLSSKLEEIKPILDEHPGLGEEIMSELTELDEVYEGLKKDLKDNVANQEVVEAMIQNYRMRLSILEEILKELKNDDDEDFKDQV